MQDNLGTGCLRYQDVAGGWALGGVLVVAGQDDLIVSICDRQIQLAWRRTSQLTAAAHLRICTI
jgi:hypothetical protein